MLNQHTVITAILILFPIFSLNAEEPVYEVETIWETGPLENRIDLIILGDGYREQDQQKLTTDANNFISLLSREESFNKYKYYFNIKIIHVISNDNGADNGDYGEDRDTVLDAYFNCGDIPRLLCIDTSKAFSIAQDHVEGMDYLFVIVNDTMYGGSGGNIATMSANSMAGYVGIHEFGHSFAGLADEYADDTPGYPGCPDECPEPNVTVKTELDDIKWNSWIKPDTPVPTPETWEYIDKIGLFEGARYQANGIYRPKQNCRMGNLQSPLCEICNEAFIKTIYENVSLIEETLPENHIEIGKCGYTTLYFKHPDSNPSTLSISWYLDNELVSNGETTYTFINSDLSSGEHLIKVLVIDDTEFVRQDEFLLLLDEYIWNINVLTLTKDGCNINDICYLNGDVNPDNGSQICDTDLDENNWSNYDHGICDDELFCNGVEQCNNGQCETILEPCENKNLNCTKCSELTKSCNNPKPGFCVIDNQCYSNNDTHPKEPCKLCLSDNKADNWTELNEQDCDNFEEEPINCDCSSL